MVRYKRVRGKTYRRIPGSPALWGAEGSNLSKSKNRFSTMELEHKRKKRR